jgi:hypothetical protein
VMAEQKHYFLNISSLGVHFRPDLAAFKQARSPFILDDAARTANMRSITLPKDRKICGLSWKSTREIWGEGKSINLLALRPILQMPGWTFVNLQYGETEEATAAVKRELGVEIVSLPDLDRFNDLDGLVSLITCCDFVVTTSNSTAHLVGARGVDCALLAPSGLSRNWYWQAIEGRSYWYPTMRIHQQSNDGDWSSAIEQTRQLLADMAGS